MGNFNNRKNDRSRNGGFNGGFNRGFRDDRPREMHKAVCDECKKECEVPFKPTGDKPVYCKECFDKKNPRDNRRNDRSRGGGFNRGFNRGFRDRDSRPREMHKAVCDECKKECEVPFKPTGDKPVYCKECYAERR